MSSDLRVQSTRSSSHVILDDLRNDANVLDHILALELAVLDGLEDALGTRFESQSRITITGDLVLAREFRFGRNERFACSRDGS